MTQEQFDALWCELIDEIDFVSNADDANDPNQETLAQYIDDMFCDRFEKEMVK